MKSTEPLIALWTPLNEPRSFRVRFTDGGIVVLSMVFTLRGADEAMSASGVLLRVMRPSATVGVPLGEQLIFDLRQVRDVADQDTGDLLFPPERAFKRSRVARFLGNNHRKQHIYGRVIALCIGLFGAGLTAVGVTAKREQERMARWPVAQGTMLLNEIRGYWTQISSGGRYSSRKSENRWYPAVRYEYEVDGRTYAGTRFFSVEWKLGFKTPNEVRVFTSSFKKGGPVTVHYDPTYPAESYLLVGNTESSRSAVGIGVMVLVVAIVWWWLAGLAMKALKDREELQGRSSSPSPSRS